MIGQQSNNRPTGSSPLASAPCSQKEKPCVIFGELKYKKDKKISIEMKYTKNVFYIKHLEIYLPLIFMHTRIALKDT